MKTRHLMSICAVVTALAGYPCLDAMAQTVQQQGQTQESGLTIIQTGEQVKSPESVHVSTPPPYLKNL